MLLDLALRLFPKEAFELKGQAEAEAAWAKKRARTEKKILTLLTSPTDGAKLVSVKYVNAFDILRASTNDGSIWLYTEDKGLHKPDPMIKSSKN